jgi:tetratricopeptide (TPR) repeat protein
LRAIKSNEVIQLLSIESSQFVEAVQPLLECKDLKGLHKLLKSRWTLPQLTSFLASSDDDVRKVAALALAYVGGKCCVDAVASQLHHPDPVVNQMAEHALWSIWFRCGSCEEANHQLCRGTKALNRRDFSHAISHFTRAIELDPNFSEAYNQRAIVKYLQERYDESIQDCLHTVELMPCHFGAWAGLGHCHAHEGHLRDAVESYDRALKINPHMECVRQMVCELRKKISEA